MEHDFSESQPSLVPIYLEEADFDEYSVTGTQLVSYASGLGCHGEVVGAIGMV